MLHNPATKSSAVTKPNSGDELQQQQGQQHAHIFVYKADRMGEMLVRCRFRVK